MIAGLSSLALPERRGEPAYRAFALYLAASVVTLFAYTAAKATHLATANTLIEERNLFFLSPLLLVGAALALGARKLDWRVVGGVSALVVWSFWSAQLEVGAPYFEAPGLAILTLVNRNFIWTVQDVHLMLLVACAVSLVLLLLRRRRGVALAAVVLAGAWMLTGEIYATISDNDEANKFAATLPPPRSWVDQATGGRAVTFLGQAIIDPNELWLTEFWNRSLHHVASLDGTAPGPGPATAPSLLAPDGRLGGYTGDPYTLTSGGVALQGVLVAARDGFSLYRSPHGWRLLNSETGVYSDGWMSKDSYYTFFRPGGPGLVRIDLSRTAYNGTGPPGRVRIRIGTVVISKQGEPGLGRVSGERDVSVRDGGELAVTLPVASSPVTVWVHVSNLISDPPDPRPLGVQIKYSFVRSPGRG